MAQATTSSTPPTAGIPFTKDFLYFGSRQGPPYYKLSNFFYAPLSIYGTFWFHDLPETAQASFLRACPQLLQFLLAHVSRGYGGVITFPSTEHFWQALKAANEATFLAFTSSAGAQKVGGWNPTVFFHTVAKKKELMATRKMENWCLKNQLGIQAKLAVSRSYRTSMTEVFGLQLRDEVEHLPADVERDVWMTLLGLKYEQCAAFAKTLDETRGRELVEINRGAKRDPAHAYWNGLVDKKEQRLYGQNKMGQYLMALRDSKGH